ncbi:phage baseplate assembly protein V [uncultured Shewanella sp.]|uniref:phage baseplate assembly protein V n=1 Tax=uncultured Shewanella sp. TaxID=173975 RepID=UPI0026249DBE|nr:phage baseplate assembly protein V [uncultured Shewanella sp.]
MRDAIESLVREQLRPYLAQLSQLSSETEEVRRRMQSMIRLGRVSDIHENNKLIKVEHGALTTPFIKWFAHAAGKVSHYRCPSVGEQVLLLNFGAGYSAQQYIALVGLISEDFLLEGNAQSQVITHFGNKCSQIWDMNAGTLTLKADAKITLDTPLVEASKDAEIINNLDVGKHIKAGADITDKKQSMAEDRRIYNGHTHPYKDDGVDTTTAKPTEQQ